MKLSMILDVALGVLLGSLALDGVHAFLARVNPQPGPPITVTTPHIEFGHAGDH